MTQSIFYNQLKMLYIYFGSVIHSVSFITSYLLIKNHYDIRQSLRQIVELEFPYWWYA